MSEWINVPDDITPYIGFCYLIVNTLTDRKYIGKKNYWRVEKRKPGKYKMKDGKYVKKKGKRVLNTRTNRRHFKRETKWREYWGSCDKLKEDIEEFGEENFRKIIIENHTCAFDLSYAEAKYQFDNEVLFKDEFYNNMIHVRLGGQNGITR